MTEKPSNIEISGYDLDGPETESNVASISFTDPDNVVGIYCVGFKFKGGDLKDPDNWEYDHASYWTPETLEDDSITESPVSKERVVGILAEHGQSISINTLLQSYCALIRNKRKSQ